MRILGLDPSISSTGWGIIEMNGNRLSYVADGFIPTSAKDTLSNRLHTIYTELRHIIELYKPDEASIEITFLNTNPETSLKLSMARGVVFLMPAIYNIPLFEYEPNKIKKSSDRSRQSRQETSGDNGKDSPAWLPTKKQRLLGRLGYRYHALQPAQLLQRPHRIIFIAIHTVSHINKIHCRHVIRTDLCLLLEYYRLSLFLEKLIILTSKDLCAVKEFCAVSE